MITIDGKIRANVELHRADERLVCQVVDVAALKLRAVQELAERLDRKMHAIVPATIDQFGGDVTADDTLEPIFPKFLTAWPEVWKLLGQSQAPVAPDDTEEV